MGGFSNIQTLRRGKCGGGKAECGIRKLPLISRHWTLDSFLASCLLTLDSGLSTHPYLRPVHDGHVEDLRRLMHLDHAAEPVVIGDAERGVPELGGSFHEPDRVGRPVEEAEVGMGVKLCVPCHSTTLIEHMFDR